MEVKIMKARMVFVAMAGLYGCRAGLKRQNFTENLQLLVNRLAPITSILADGVNSLNGEYIQKSARRPFTGR
jgi:hypothetical protein